MEVIDPNASPGPDTAPAGAAPGGGHDAEEGVIFNARRVTQVFVIFATAICYWLFSVGGSWVDFPVEYKHSGSVLYQSNGILKLLLYWVMLVACTALATMLTSWRWFLAGLFCACLGSSAWAASGGISRFVLFSASSPSVFLVLAAEQVLLMIGIAAMWVVLWQLQQAQPPISVTPEEPAKKDPSSDREGDPIYAVAIQALTMGILVLLLAATDRNKQVGAAVFIAAACGTALANFMQQKAQNLSKWYWAGPLLVGLVGYVGCFLSPRGWELGQPTGTFAALARPLPICYASFGMAGALFGCWMTETVLALSIGTILAITHTHYFVPRKARRRGIKSA